MMAVHHAITLLIDDHDVTAIDAIVLAELRNSRESIDDCLHLAKEKKIYDALGVVIDYFTGDSDGEDHGKNNGKD